MTVASAVRARLLALSALTALVTTRVAVLRLPENPVLPAVKVQQVGETEDMHLRGSAGLRRSRVQVDSYAREASGTDPYASASAVDAAVHGDGAGSGLCGWQGSVGSPAVEITGILPIDRREGYDPDERRIVMVSRDYWVYYRA